MSALTVQQILEHGMKELAVGAAGEPIQPEDMADGLIRFNMLIDSWKAERLMIYKVLRELYTISANVASYTLGPSGVWATPTMPLAIVRAGFVDTTVPSAPIELPVYVYTDEEWARVVQKNITSTIIRGLWYRTDYTTNAQADPAGTGTAFVYPVCTRSAQMALYLPVAIDEVASDETTAFTTTILVPPGYRKAMVTSMAMELADMFEIDPSPRLVAKWNMAMKIVKRANTKPMTLALPRALTRRGRGGGGYNILTNQ